MPPSAPQETEEAHGQPLSEGKLSVGCVGPLLLLKVGGLIEFDRCSREFEEHKKWSLTPEKPPCERVPWEGLTFHGVGKSHFS